MKLRTFVVVGVTGLLAGCGPTYSLVFSDDKPTDEVGVNRTEEGFFTMRYVAYRGTHKLGGTLNELSIRNLSQHPLRVEKLSLVQMFRGQDVTAKNAPIPFDGLTGAIEFGHKPIPWRDIAPGEWMTFDFPTDDIRAFAEGDKMQLKLQVILVADSHRYQRDFEFSKTLVKRPLPSL